jgi:predicted alpha/beta hydrolase family esterase
MATEATIVFVPGIRDHVEDHWQTLLAARLPRADCVPRLGKGVLALSAWVDALDATIARHDGPVWLAAHSAGAVIVANWARDCWRPVAGALLATPPDFARPLPAGYPSLESLSANGWVPIPRARLPFPSIVAASRNDPLGDFGSVAELAGDWGSKLHDAGKVGHLNGASGFGEWKAAPDLLRELGVPPRALSLAAA